MNINIKISDIMSENTGEYGNEDNFLRVPKVLRQQLNLELGQEIALNSVQNKPVVLTVSSAYQEDTQQDDTRCYVTDVTFVMINTGTLFACDKLKAITLGCDPEFFLVDKRTDCMLQADKFFKKYGEIGNDGIIAELRPKPAVNADTLTDNLFELIKQTRQILNTTRTYDPTNIKLLGASSHSTVPDSNAFTGLIPYAVCGFHLHFGLPYKLRGTTVAGMAALYRLSRVMDYFVGILSVLIEKDDSKRRTTKYLTYGKPSDFRADNRTYEYRVAGGSVLSHPIYTKGIIAVGAVAMTDIVSNVQKTTNNFKDMSVDKIENMLDSVYAYVPRIDKMYDILCAPDTTKAAQLTDSVYNHLTKMKDFERNRNSINMLFNTISSKKDTGNDIELNWRNVYEPRTDVCNASYAYTA